MRALFLLLILCLGLCLPACSSDNPLVVVAVMYAADGKTGLAGNLYIVDVTDASTTIVGPIGFALTGMAVSPSGTIYGTEAVASIQGGTGPAQLIMVDPQTGAGTVVGPLDDAMANNFPAIAGLTFVGSVLIGWTDGGGPVGDQPVQIDITTGLVTPIGGGINSYGSGMATDRSGTVYVAPDGNDVTAGGTAQLSTVDTATGAVTAGPVMTGGDPNLDAVNAMAFHNGVLYAINNDENSNPATATEFVAIDTATGVITRIGLLPTGVDALASTVP